jgi:hypothetical protein
MVKTRKSTDVTLNAIREYRREISWLTDRLAVIEQKVKGQPNVRAETGRGK